MRFVKRFGNGCKEKNDDVSEFVPPAKALKRERDLPILFGCEFCQCFYLQALLMKICMEQRYLFASCFNSLDWFHLQRPWKRKKFTHFVWLWKLALFWVFSCRLCMTVLNFFMEQRYFFASHLHSLDWFHLQRLWKQRKRFIHFVWLWKLAVFYLQALHGGSEHFYGTEVLSCFTLEFFRLVHSLPLKMIIIMVISVAHDP